jgi:hypothetical protein
MAMSSNTETQVFKIEKTWEQVKLIKLTYLFENDTSADKYICKQMENLAMDCLMNNIMKPVETAELLSAFMQKAMPWVLHDPMCPITEIKMAMGLSFDTFAHKVHIMYKSIWNPFDYMKISISIGS